MKSIRDYETVALDDENDAVVIIDQTLLPGKTELISLKTGEEIWNAICFMAGTIFIIFLICLGY